MQYMYNAYCWTCVHNSVYYLKQEYEHWSWRYTRMDGEEEMNVSLEAVCEDEWRKSTKK